MIVQYEELDTLVMNSLTNILLFTRTTPVTVLFSEPEEGCYKRTLGQTETALVNVIRADDWYDEVREQAEGVDYVLNQQTNTFETFERPDPVTFLYQIDLYSQKQLELLHLRRAVERRMPRRRGYFVDTTGQTLYYRMTDVRDRSRYDDEERLYRLCLSYEIPAFVARSTTPIATGKTILSVKLDFHKDDPANSDPLIETITVTPE